MNKRERILQYKRIQNGLPKYDLAAKNTSSGYQQGDDFTIGTPSVQTGYDPSDTINQQSSEIIPNALANVSSQLSMYNTAGNLSKSLVNPIMKYMPNAVTPILSTAASSRIAQAGADASAKAIVASMAGEGYKNLGSQAVTQAARNASNEAMKNASGEVAKEAMKNGATKLASTVVNVPMAAYGLYNLGRGLLKGADVPTSANMDATKSLITQSMNGVDYTTKEAGDLSMFDKQLRNNETSRTINNTINGASAGFAVGSFLPGLGNIIGAGIGGLIGGIGSLFGRGRRRRALQRSKNNLIQSYDNYNDQSESVAASEGLRNQFYQNTYNPTSLYSADDGKTAVDYNLMNKPARAGYGMVFDKDGYHFGPKNSRVGKGESIINFDEGKLAYIDKGKKRADDQYSSVEEGDNNYIAGNDIDWSTGISFADQVAPASKYFQKLEKIKQAIQNNKHGDDKTKQLNLDQIQQMQDQLVESVKEPMKRQEMQHKMENKYDGYMPQYDGGKFNLNWLQPLIYAGAYMIPNNQYKYYKNSTPEAANSYVRNQNADRALGILGSMRFDPYQQVEQVRNAYRQGAYNIANAGGLSQGQRMKMMAAHNNNYMYNMAKLYGDANDVNNKYRQAYAQALLQEGGQYAARQQQALAQQQQAYREAVARRLLGMENANQGRLNLLGTLGKNLFQQQQYNATQDYNNRILDLYDAQANLDKYKFDKSLEQYNTPMINSYYGNYFNSLRSDNPFGVYLSKPKQIIKYNG